MQDSFYKSPARLLLQDAVAPNAAAPSSPVPEKQENRHRQIQVEGGSRRGSGSGVSEADYARDTVALSQRRRHTRNSERYADAQCRTPRNYSLVPMLNIRDR
eukprot:4372000-Pleurochrysis_carterae.AAC.3